MDDLLEAPARARLFREARGLIELPRLLFRFPELAREPRGDGEPVLILPGYGAGDWSTITLQAYLRLLGYRADGWGLGRNKGTALELLPKLLDRAVFLARRRQRKIHVIGWSFGGYLARELARERADLIRHVITLGTPVIGGPKYTVVAESFRRLGIDVEALAAEVEQRNRISFSTPVTAIYSRNDAVVAWKACIDRSAANIEHIEVGTTHFGLGFSPEVYQIIARRLAAARS
jgi:pimeloyl-ACP methyl ester carboxylesterase